MNDVISAELTSIQEWIASKHGEGIDLSLDTDLIENRLIDSLDFAEFLFVLEDITGKAIDLDSVDLQTFRTLRGIRAHFLQGG